MFESSMYYFNPCTVVIIIIISSSFNGSSCKSNSGGGRLVGCWLYWGLTAKSISWLSVTDMCFLAFSHQY